MDVAQFCCKERGQLTQKGENLWGQLVGRGAEEGSYLSLRKDGDRFPGLLAMVVGLGPSLVLIISLGKHPGCSLPLRRKLLRCFFLQRAIY